VQIRRNSSSRLTAWIRLLHDRTPHHNDAGPAQTSPMLIFVATVLALLLAMIEIDLHAEALQAIGLMTDNYRLDPIFKAP
jgi:hypothetical protein